MPLREDPTYHVGGLTKNMTCLVASSSPHAPHPRLFLKKQNASSTSSRPKLLFLSLFATNGYGGSDTGVPSKGADVCDSDINDLDKRQSTAVNGKRQTTDKGQWALRDELLHLVPGV